MTIRIYTDGACLNNPGLGSYCAIIIDENNNEHIITGINKYTTNNRMELLGIIEALKTIKEPSEIEIYTDSQYIVYSFTQERIFKWVKNGWKTTTKCDVRNKDLWIQLLEYYNIHKIKFFWVKGHCDNQYNLKCDQIARDIIREKYKYKKS